MRYNNYHKHTKYSSALVPDTFIDMEEYFKRAKELGHTNYFTTEHGFAGSVFEAKKLGNKYGIKVIFAMEVYIVEDNQEKDRTNAHMVVIARTDKARKKMNLINSNAHDTGYYYTARWSLSDILSFSEDDVYITTACVGGILKNDESIEKLFKPIAKKFKSNFFIEIHNYNHPTQISHNKKALALAEEYQIPLIHANDSHYIHPEQHKDRLAYLKGKGITYDDEDAFILDYPEYDEIVRRYQIQNVVPYNVVLDSIKRTLIFDDCEELAINDDIKMPTPPAYRHLNPDGRFETLRRILGSKWEEEKKKLAPEKHESRIEAIKYELNIVKETNDVVHTADYFLLNENIVRTAKKKYGGVLTQTGRGSGISFYINKLLGFSGLDRVDMDVPILPTRFISASRLLDSKSLPDIDYNVADPEPFMLATKELLGEDGCHWMLAYGTMQQSEAFRNICRNLEIPFDDFNDIAKYVSETFKKASSSDEEEAERWDSVLEFAKKNGSKKYKWTEIIKDAQTQVGSIVSVSRHPCAALIMNENIREEVGLIRSGDDLCAVITSMESDVWKYLKNDYLTVSVVKIIDQTFKKIDVETPDVNEFLGMMNDKAWKLYEDGITATLNQASTQNGTRLVKQYKPKNYVEMSSFVAIIRPACETLLQDFLDRKPYDNGVEALNQLLSTTENRILYQESIMKFLVWLGIPEDETYTVLKKISKKVYHKPEYREEFKQLKVKLSNGWMTQVGNLDDFERAWDVIESAVRYLFNASHSLSVGLDSMYGAYLKANYPLEYYSVVLDMYESNIEMTDRLVDELNYFNIKLLPIQFRKSKDSYVEDSKSSSIYKGMSSVKFINHQCSQELYELRHNQYSTFTDLLIDIRGKTSCNSRQIEVLIKLDFFKEFGQSKKLLTTYHMFKEWSKKKTAKKEALPFEEGLIRKYAQKESVKQYSGVDYVSIIRDCEGSIDNEALSTKERIDSQLQYLGYINFQDKSFDKRYVLVTNLDTKYSPKFIAYCLNNGITQELKVRKKPKRRQPNNVYFEDSPFKNGDILYVSEFERKMGVKKVEDEWVDTGIFDFWCKKYKVVEDI